MSLAKPIEQSIFESLPVASSQEKHYSIGFMFTPGGVILINKPDARDWQAGRLNGVGGIIENESPLEAMVREFKEETGLETTFDDWFPVCRLVKDDEWTLWVFTANVKTEFLGHTTDEGTCQAYSPNPAHLLINGEIDTTAYWLLLAAIDIIATGARIESA